MDELHRHMREVAESVAGDARLPGPAAARARGRQLRRRKRSGATLLAALLVIASVPAAVQLGVLAKLADAPVVGGLARELPSRGFGPLTASRYESGAAPRRKVLSAVEVVAGGTYQGRRWRMVAFRGEEDGGPDRLLCTSTELEGEGGDSVCSAATAKLSWTARPTPEAWLVTGFAASTATRVELRLDDGTVAATLYPGNGDLPVTFFSAVVGPGSSAAGWRAGTVVALDGRGRTVCEQRLGARPPVPGSC
jgi:hypothetical protein